MSLTRKQIEKQLAEQAIIPMPGGTVCPGCGLGFKSARAGKKLCSSCEPGAIAGAATETASTALQQLRGGK